MSARYNRREFVEETPVIVPDEPATHWVEVVHDFDWRPTRVSMITYAPGTYFFTARAADALEASGRGKRVPRPDDLKTEKSGKVVARDQPIAGYE